MPTYCYSLNIDGVDQPMQSHQAAGREEGIAIGRTLLTQALQARPVTAYCAVFEDAGTDDEPLGAWDYEPSTGEVTWTAEE